MKALVIYDSMFGNTESVARVVARTCGAKLVNVGEFKSEDLDKIELLIIGSPTQAGQPTVAIQKVLVNIPKLTNVKVSAFDTRMVMKWVKVFGFASNKIISKLQAKGGTLSVQPGGFFVKSKNGPLLENELDRARQWAETIL